MWSDYVRPLAPNCVRQTHVRVFDIVTPVFASGAHLLLRTFARPLAPPPISMLPVIRCLVDKGDCLLQH